MLCSVLVLIFLLKIWELSLDVFSLIVRSGVNLSPMLHDSLSWLYAYIYGSTGRSYNIRVFAFKPFMVFVQILIIIWFYVYLYFKGNAPVGI